MKTTSKILNRTLSVKGPAVATLLHPSRATFSAFFKGGDRVFHIIAWLLGPPISLIVLFLLLSTH